jgi:hypothetical protein
VNERIDQLWGQALDLTVPETYSQLSHSQVLKVKQVFAELIIRECAGVGYDASYYECALNVSNKIKQHFGVEE